MRFSRGSLSRLCTRAGDAAVHRECHCVTPALSADVTLFPDSPLRPEKVPVHPILVYALRRSLRRTAEGMYVCLTALCFYRFGICRIAKAHRNNLFCFGTREVAVRKKRQHPDKQACQCLSDASLHSLPLSRSASDKHSESIQTCAGTVFHGPRSYSAFLRVQERRQEFLNFDNNNVNR